MGVRRRARTCARGVAAVEFALVLPLLLALVLGSIEWGYYFFVREVVVNASREGARAGTFQYAVGTSPTTAAENAARTYITSAGLPSSKIVSVTTSPCDTASSCVSIVYQYSTLTRFLDDILGSTLTVRAYAQMRKQ